MSKKSWLVLILAPAVLIPAYLVWTRMQEFRDFTQYFELVSVLIDESAKKNEIEKNTDYTQRMEDWNRELAVNLDRIYESYRAGEDKNINTAIRLTRTLFDDLFALRTEFAAVVEPFVSERMQDRNTVKNKDSYEWRIGVIESIDQYAVGYHARLEQIVERFRQSVVGSDLTEKYKQYVWQHWARDLVGKLQELGPEVQYFENDAQNFRHLFDYLHKYPDMYYINDNQIVIRNERDLKEYRSITRSVGRGW